MLKIDHDQTLVFSPGFNSYLIDHDHDLHLDLKIKEDCNVFFRIRNVKELTISGDIAADKKATILFWNDMADDLTCKERYEVSQNSELDIAYGECNEGATFRDTEMLISGDDGKGLLSSASLVNDRKTYDLKLINDARRSIGRINNYAVVLSKGRLTIDAVGKICKGAKQARSHQVSRALAFARGQSATILPELLIDENDVQASHAMSIGKVDENHLYYMMSRGLDLKQCTRLISMGYLMPIIDLIEDDELKKALHEELERKISEICSM